MTGPAPATCRGSPQSWCHPGFPFRMLDLAGEAAFQRGVGPPSPAQRKHGVLHAVLQQQRDHACSDRAASGSRCSSSTVSRIVPAPNARRPSGRLLASHRQPEGWRVAAGAA